MMTLNRFTIMSRTYRMRDPTLIGSLCTSLLVRLLHNFELLEKWTLTSPTVVVVFGVGSRVSTRLRNI